MPLWKDFERDPAVRRSLKKQISDASEGLRRELNTLSKYEKEAAKLQKNLGFLSMKLNTAYEEKKLLEELATRSDDIAPLFSVRSALEHISVQALGLTPETEAHVLAAVRQWRLRLESAPWMKEIRAAEEEERRLLKRKEELLRAIEIRKKEEEILTAMESDKNVFKDCASSEDAMKLIQKEFAKITVEKEEKVKEEEEDVKSEDLLSPPLSRTSSMNSVKSSSSDSEDNDEWTDDMDFPISATTVKKAEE